MEGVGARGEGGVHVRTFNSIEQQADKVHDRPWRKSYIDKSNRGLSTRNATQVRMYSYVTNHFKKHLKS